MVVRRDIDLALIGQQAALPPDLSPLQLGTTGTFQGQPFVLVGRVRMGYAEGSWNEWCADFGEGRWGWIAEAQGYFMASFEVPPPPDLPGIDRWTTAFEDSPGWPSTESPWRKVGLESLAVGEELTLSEVHYTVRDIKEAQVIGSEGSLPFIASPQRESVSVDLGAPGLRFANIEYSKTGIRLFLGKTCQFHELALDQLRPVPGWTSTEQETIRDQSVAVSCPSCGATVSLRAVGFSMSAVCGSCGQILDCSTPTIALIESAQSLQTLTPRIPIGQRGQMDGVEYECIGALLRSDASADSWQELLLFNPFHGFRWLVYFRGHWSFITVLLEPPLAAGNGVYWNETSFRKFSSGQAEVINVIGEFYWKVRRGDKAEVTDFIAPPMVLSRERYPELREETWSCGRYTTGHEIYSAFGMEGHPFEPSDVYLNQPNPFIQQARQLTVPTAVAVGVVILAKWLANEMSSGKPLVQQSFEYQAGKTNQTFVTPEFRVPSGILHLLTLQLSAPVSDNWLDVDFSLVNLDTEEVREASIEVSYYSGYDDGPWTEGSRQGEELLSGVPPGRYTIRLEPSADPSIQDMTFDVQVLQGGSIWSTTLLALTAVLAAPAWYWGRTIHFEERRWEK